MILDEKDYGSFTFRGKEYKLRTTIHANAPRGTSSIPRDSLSKSKYVEVVTAADNQKHIKDNTITGIVWKHSNGFYRGVLIIIKEDLITIITTILSKNKTERSVFRDRIQPENLIIL